MAKPTITRASWAHNKPRHGMSRTPLFRRWAAIHDRCLNPNDKGFSLYGGRGITIDPRWRTFTNFLADMGPRPDGMELERIDNDGPYSPENCRWATRREQMRNMRRNRFVVLGGKSMCVVEAAELMGIPSSTIGVRVHKKKVTHQEAVDYFAAKHSYKPHD